MSAATSVSVPSAGVKPKNQLFLFISTGEKKHSVSILTAIQTGRKTTKNSMLVLTLHPLSSGSSGYRGQKQASPPHPYQHHFHWHCVCSETKYILFWKQKCTGSTANGEAILHMQTKTLELSKPKEAADLKK